jgi:hypothetical protein
VNYCLSRRLRHANGYILFIDDLDTNTNDLDTDIMTHIGKFAVNTKLGGKVITNQDVDQIQNDLNKIEEWAFHKWQMNFNVDKCKVMHVVRNHHRHDHRLNY